MARASFTKSFCPSCKLKKSAGIITKCLTHHYISVSVINGQYFNELIFFS